MNDPFPTPAYRATSSRPDGFAAFLTRSAVVDYDHPAVAALAREFRRATEIETARAAYVAVRDRYPHSHDIGATEVSVSASDVVRNGHGICFAKLHLLAAVLRCCGIPVGFCYQRLLFDDAEPGRTCLHGFNAVWLGDPGRWHRLDARGNKPGIDAVFDPGRERLAFRVRSHLGERDYREIHAEPLLSVVEALTGSRSIAELNIRLPPDLYDG
jgi:transglutaminase-like putative cysteine protease